MDYTLIHYQVSEWENRAYQYLKEKLSGMGWPVEHLQFDPNTVIRGLILDIELGNTIKVNRFGYVKLANHGTRRLEFSQMRSTYAGTVVELSEDRYIFLNTLFSVSEASMYAQLVDLLDERKLPGVLGYMDLYKVVRRSIDEAHIEGRLKAEIIADPDRFVELDPDIPLTLLDQRHAGKKLILITNSEWPYTRSMMSYAFDSFLPGEMTWRDLFDLVIVSARKPTFFTTRSPLFRVVSDDGLVEPCKAGIEGDGVYLGGNAAFVEEYADVTGDEILYVGDHIFTDVHVTKNISNWRTALIVRELESDLADMAAFREQQDRLSKLMAKKGELEFEVAWARLQMLRKRAGYGPQGNDSLTQLDKQLSELRRKLTALDEEIAPLAAAAGGLGNARWGPLMRAGNDKSHLARQVERYADIYMSRVSNLLSYTPFVYLRAPRGSLPHDPEDMPLVVEGATE